MSRVILAMSGGVDSSVAAWLLREAGHEVIGLFMRHGEQSPQLTCATGQSSRAVLPILTARPGHKQGCCSASDAEDARRVADRLNIPFYALDFQEEFGQIMDYFAAEYMKARTPNPCVVCNNWLKFGKLWEYAQQIGGDYIATGHYAQVLPTTTGEPGLFRGIDDSKDQSYVLFGISREILPRLMFPVGSYSKPEIRRLATELGLRVADKKDSMEICFVPDGDYAAFVRRRYGSANTHGEIVTTSGEVVGTHTGFEHFTIGQRKGLGIAFGEPRYVVRLEPETRRVVIGTRDDLECQQLTAARANWLQVPPREPFTCTVKIRYQSQPVEATIIPESDDVFRVEMHEPRLGVAPGQAVVCYQDDQVLGGGWIESQVSATAAVAEKHDNA